MRSCKHRSSNWKRCEDEGWSLDDGINGPTCNIVKQLCRDVRLCPKNLDADHVICLHVGDKTFKSRVEECNMCKGTGQFEDFPECPFCDGTGMHVTWNEDV
jgi:RecJ-like exonuclease